ncbi:heparinase II/III domain-containing protein [Ohtaekwangia koreensis]|uniref:Uncharacterized protein n=1 Tax=Ohtaekwangia koreensis TaxID=688867 RepID=A0A1T5JRZ4_9BACT|nr:heparinase II/III family protein [Ohtaekwangia koreensis]SKC54237.1 protein of unknown function [Ohtaekwangia koreensis]
MCSRYKIYLTLLLLYVVFIPAISQDRQAGHPFLFFTKDRVQHLQETIKKDTAIARAWSDMKTKVDRLLAESKEANIEVLSLAWCMTGDVKYAVAARSNLLQLIDRKQWDGMDDRTPRWNSGLNTAHTCFSAAVAFDCIYVYLTPADRKQIAQGILQLGIKPLLDDWISEDKRIHSLNSMGHNWWSACAYMAGVASIAVRQEIPEATEWAHTIMQASKEWFAFSGSVLENKPSNFDAAGGFYESISYADFGMSEYLYFRLAYTHAFGAVKMPYDVMLEKTADWFINGCYPNSNRMMSLNFGDSNPFATGVKPIKLMLALGYKKEQYQWYLQEVKNSVSRDITSPVGLVLEPDYDNKISVPALPPSAIYSDMGWAMLRSSWNKNATLLGIKCGYTWNHAHADAGSFVLYHRGKNLLIDGGDVNYGLPEYSSYFVRSEAHNVMLFNGQAQDSQDQYHAVKNPGRLYNLIDAGKLKYILADATGPTSHFFLRNYRNFLWVGNVILVIDDVKTYEPGKFEWLLHAEKDVKQKGPDLEITCDSASVLVRPLFPEMLPTGYPHDFPEKMKLEERVGIKDRDAKTKITYYAISPAEPSRQTKFITAILLLDDANKPIKTFTGSSGASGAAGRTNLPILEKLEGKDMIGVKITQGEEVTYIYFNLLADGRLMHRNSINTMNGWETDAYMLVITFPEKSDTGNPDDATEYFVSNGSFLRKDEKVIVHSLSKVFMSVQHDDGKLNVHLQGQPIINVKLLANKKPTVLRVNDVNTSPIYTKGKLKIVLDETAKSDR